MAGKFLDGEARAAFARAVEQIEQVSAAEVVIAVRRRSAAYRHANVIVGAAVAVAGLAAMLFSAHVFALPSILVDPFVVGGIAGALVEWLPGVKRRLTPRALRERLVLRAARATFVERGVHRTRDRSGLLVYISWLEHDIAVVGDTGIEASLPGDVARTLAAAMAGGGASVARALERLAPALAAAAPRRADDINELPDAIDSDLDAGDRRAP